MSEAMRVPTSPGEILREEFRLPLDLSEGELALALGTAPERIEGIERGEGSVDAGMALRLSRYFGTTPEFWLNLQSRHDLGRERAVNGEAIRASVTPRNRAA